MISHPRVINYPVKSTLFNRLIIIIFKIPQNRDLIFYPTTPDKERIHWKPATMQEIQLSK